MQILHAEIERNADGTRSPQDVTDEEASKIISRSLSSSIDIENIIVLAGSGTSLTFNTDRDRPVAPSMDRLWRLCSDMDPVLFNECLDIVNYEDVQDVKDEGGDAAADIELLLSLCDSYRAIGNLSDDESGRLNEFVERAKDQIIEATDFANNVVEENWQWHEKFLRRIGRRSPNQKRMKLFTTNYDLAFEIAASRVGFTIIDGFNFTSPSTFNPMWYQYDIVSRPRGGEAPSSYLPNVFQLYKLHGSVDWRRINGQVRKEYGARNGDPVFIYPSSTKYQSSYDSPYLEMVSAFINALQQPKTALLCVGFGFNDKHLNNAVSLALRTNPEFLLTVATRSLFSPRGTFNADIRAALVGAVNAGDGRITLIDGTFAELAERLPARHERSPQEDLLKTFEAILTDVSGGRA